MFNSDKEVEDLNLRKLQKIFSIYGWANEWPIKRKDTWKPVFNREKVSLVLFSCFPTNFHSRPSSSIRLLINKPATLLILYLCHYVFCIQAWVKWNSVRSFPTLSSTPPIKYFRKGEKYTISIFRIILKTK